MSHARTCKNMSITQIDAEPKLFLGGRRRGFSEEQKHRTSLHKTSVLLRQNIGTLCQRSPMFLISGNGNVSGLRANSAIRERQRIRQNPVFTNKDPARTNSGNDAPPRAPEGVRLSLGAGVHWEHRGGEEQDAGTGIPRGGEENHGNGDGQFSF